MRISTSSLSVALALAACSPQPSAPAGEGTGGQRRLKAVFSEAGGGARAFLGWKDTALDVACSFEMLEDGKLRCRPADEEVATISQSFYSDPSCSSPVAELVPSYAGDLGCSPPRYAAFPSSCQPRAYHRVGARVTPEKAYQVEAGLCVLKPLPQNPNSVGIFEFEAIDPTAFVAGSLVEGPASGGIVPISIVSEDGASRPWAFRDADGGFDCDLSPTLEGVRCLPTDRFFIRYRYADSKCTVPAALGGGCVDLRPSIPFGFEMVPGGLKIFEGGDRLDTGYEGSSSACTEAGAQAATFSVGKEIPSSRFASGFKEEVSLKGGFVESIKHAGGASLVTGLRSTAFGGFDCHFAPTSDGVVRCVPAPERSLLTFSDDKCTRRVSSNSASDTKELLSIVDATTCPSRVRIFARGDVHSGAVYLKTGETCTFYFNHPVGSVKPVIYSYASELSPDSLVAMRRVEQ